MLAICLSYARQVLVICLYMRATCLQHASYSMCTRSGTVPTDRKANKMNRAPNERLTWAIMIVICLPYACHMLAICWSYECHMLTTCLQYASYSMSTESGTGPTNRKAKKINRAPNERLTWTVMLVICLSYACHMLVICLSYACHIMAIWLPHACSMLLSLCTLNQALSRQIEKPKNEQGA